jgi:hypothetical protein
MNSSGAMPSQSALFVQEFFELVRGQLEAACAELTQTDRLLDEAIEQLSLSFHALGEGLQSTEDARIGQNDPPLLPYVHLAITSLQFHDLTHQLLERIHLRLEALKAAASALEPEGCEPDWALERETLGSRRAELDRKLHKELHQHDLSTGDIELF